jgi:UDP-N-acetyl-D-galactosamine dehydrogenase
MHVVKGPEMKLAVVGLGYVGLPLAIEFGKTFSVVGLDISTRKIEEFQRDLDVTGQVDEAEFKAAKGLTFSNDFSQVSGVDCVIVAVPTPVDAARKPDLQPLIKASEAVGCHLQKGTTLVFESTVYPGMTEEVCVPILEQASGLVWRRDFFVGYSPERINPGDREHTLTRITKVVAGDTPETLERLAGLYGAIIEAGVHRAPSIKVAEAAKVIENTQRDLNIALMNELAIIFGRMDIDTRAVLEAAGTKWNFLKFYPGLVGGHCIGVDPYYLTYKAEILGYHPQVVLAGRRINDGMGKYLAEQTVKRMIDRGIQIKGARVNLLGLSFKPNVPDLRNSKVVDVIAELESYGISVSVHDPLCDPEESKAEYGLALVDWEELAPAEAMIVAVPHQSYLDAGLNALLEKISPNGVFVEVGGGFDLDAVSAKGFATWRL